MDTQIADDELTAASPPVAPRRPSQRTVHGITVVDDYAWLKDANWQEVLRNPALLDPDIRAYLEAENRYTEAFLGPLQALQKTLVAEMRGRIKEDDSSVPQPDGPFAYLWKFRRRPARSDRPHAARRRRGPGPARRRRHGQGTAVLRFRRHAPFARSPPRSLERRRPRLGVLHHPRARLADRRRSARRHRADQRQRRLGTRFDVLLLRPARRQSSAVAHLSPSAGHAAERGHAGLRRAGQRLVRGRRGKCVGPLLHRRHRQPGDLRTLADRPRRRRRRAAPGGGARDRRALQRLRPRATSSSS